MKSGHRDPFSTKGRDIFHVPEQAMNEDVTDAAKILRSFVSTVDAGPEDSQDRLYASPDEGGMFDPFSPSTPAAKDQEAPQDPGMESLLQSAAHVSNSLTDAMEFVPRVVEGASGVFSLHPKKDTPVTMKHPPLRLRYKGKASKKQLERLRKRVQLHTREG